MIFKEDYLMSNQELANRLTSICNVLNCISITGVQNAHNLSYAYNILENIILEISSEQDCLDAPPEG